MFATKSVQKFICSFDRSKDDLTAASACYNSLITAYFHVGSAESFIHTIVGRINQRNKIIAKLQCPSFFTTLFRIQTSEICINVE